MASDFALYHVNVPVASAGTNTPMRLIAGTENVRSGYGTPTLKGMRALYVPRGVTTPTNMRCAVEIRNSSWVRPQILTAGMWDSPTSLSEDSLAYESGREAVLIENSTWNITARPGGSGFTSLDTYVLIEVDYSRVPTNNVKTARGFPVTTAISIPPISVNANTLTTLISADVLDPGVEYLFQEIRNGIPHSAAMNPVFIVITGIQSQHGLNIIYPAKDIGDNLKVQMDTSIRVSKQSINFGIISADAFTTTAPYNMLVQFIASRNSI